MIGQRNYVIVYILVGILGFSSKTIESNASRLQTCIRPEHANQRLSLDTLPQKSINKESGGWEVLFNGKSTDKWRSTKGDTFPSSSWTVAANTLSVANHSKGEDIITKEQYSSFDLRFNFKLTFEANSGVKYFVEKIRNNETGQMEWNGLEYQIIDDFNNIAVKDHKHPSGSTAALYLVYAPTNKKLLPAGKWNSARIVAAGSHVEHWLNGVKVVSYTRGTADFRNRMTATKFKEYNNYGEVPMGHIMLTDHEGDKVYFSNIRIKRLN
jgi:hypothetical protein